MLFFVCFRPCVPNVACVSGLSILDLSLQFSLTFIYRFIPDHSNTGTSTLIFYESKIICPFGLETRFDYVNFIK